MWEFFSFLLYFLVLNFTVEELTSLNRMFFSTLIRLELVSWWFLEYMDCMLFTRKSNFYRKIIWLKNSIFTIKYFFSSVRQVSYRGFFWQIFFMKILFFFLVLSVFCPFRFFSFFIQEFSMFLYLSSFSV